MKRHDGREIGDDPRSARSRSALSRAVVELAAQRPITTVTITELCVLAGVTRRTFYNHAASPVELLKQVLTGELDVIGDRMRADTAAVDADLTVAVRHSFGAIVDHVRGHRSIYRDPTTGRIHPELYTLLSEHFLAALRHSIMTSIRVLPVVAGVREGSARFSALVSLNASFVAHAYAGVIEAVLDDADITTDFALDVVVAALPDWMLHSPVRPR